ncbi:MAG: AI-2E family transporter [Bryobacteraceae bacterium]
MLGIDGRTLRVVWTVFLCAAVLFFIYKVRETLTLFAVAIFLAYMLSPLVNLVERLMPKRRLLALTLVYLFLVALFVTAGIGIASEIAAQAASLASKLPAMLANPHLGNLPFPEWLLPFKDRLMAAMQNEAKALSNSAVPLLQSAGGQILSGLSALVPLILVPILSFLLLKDVHTIRVLLLGSVDDSRDRTLITQILDDIHNLLSNYIRALVILSIASFTAWFVFLQIFGAPYQLLLAGLCGLLEFIPVIGPLFAGVIVLLVCGFSGTGGLLWIIVFFAAFRTFQDYVLNPFLLSSGIEISPLLVLFGVLAGDRIAGIPGMFFSVPAIAILKVLFTRLRLAHSRRLVEEVSTIN